MDKWLPGYLARPRPPRTTGPLHVCIAVCDHFEPRHDARDHAHACERVNHWLETYPQVAAPVRDADGRGPRHSFFVPIEQYFADLNDPLAELQRQGRGEIEIHLHHHNDTADGLTTALQDGIANLRQHGAIAKDPDGKDAFCFIHGNWSLANCGGDAACGVRNEIEVLLANGCCADLTFPSAPSPTQPRRINRITTVREAGSPTVLDRGRPVQAGQALDPDELLLIHGPLGLNWQRRKAGVIPRIENADLTGANPPTLQRFRLWLELAPWVEGRPEWRFIKLHTHGGIEQNMPAHLGDPARHFHAQLAEFATANNLLIHYVTAREMVNVIHAATAGKSGNPADYFDFRFRLPEPA